MPLHFDKTHVYDSKIRTLEHELQSKDERITALSTENAMLHLRLAEQQGRAHDAYKECAHHSRLAQYHHTQKTCLSYALPDLQTHAQGLKEDLENLKNLVKQSSSEMEQSLSTELSKLLRCKLLTQSNQDGQIEAMKEKLDAAQMMIKKLSESYEKEKRKRRKLHNTLMEINGNIRVHCRVRPLLDFDRPVDEPDRLDNHEAVIITVQDDETVSVKTAKQDLDFEYDRVYLSTEKQEDIFQEVSPMITSVIDGYNACIMAYGQTGSGKTFTMLGSNDLGELSQPADLGIVPRAAQELFRTLEEQSSHSDVKVSVIEVYNNELRDLLSNHGDRNKHDIVMGPDGCLATPSITSRLVKTVEDVLMLVNRGLQMRCEAATLIHKHSSRSHLVVTLTVTLTTNKTESIAHKEDLLKSQIPKSSTAHSFKSVTSSPSKSKHKHQGGKQVTKLQFVDLAGSECVGMSGVSGAALRETSNINRSLCALADVLAALAEKRPHIPHRNSRLTHLLQDTIGGDAKLLMMLCVSPSLRFRTQSLQCLEFGQRARQVQRGPAPCRAKPSSPALKRSSSLDNCYEGVVSTTKVLQRPRSASAHLPPGRADRK